MKAANVYHRYVALQDSNAILGWPTDWQAHFNTFDSIVQGWISELLKPRVLFKILGIFDI